MEFLAGVGLALIIAFVDFLFCIGMGFLWDIDIPDDDFPVVAAVINGFCFVITLTFTICKLGLGM